ncbi:MAG: penicillin-binding protein 2, partial [Blastocatellia bacterium]
MPALPHGRATATSHATANRYKEVNVPAIFITHDQEEALELGDRIAVLNAGSLEQVGAPEEVYNQPRTEYVATFLGAANLLLGVVNRGRIEIGSAAVPAREETRQLRNGQSVKLVFRPEDVLLSRDGALSENSRRLAQGMIEEVRFAGGYERVTARLNLASPGAEDEPAISTADGRPPSHRTRKPHCGNEDVRCIAIHLSGKPQAVRKAAGQTLCFHGGTWIAILRDMEPVSGYDEYEERRQIGRRLDVLRLMAVAIFLLFGARLYWIQVIDHEAYAEMALRNRLRRLPIKAPRGRILDRNGIALADIRPSYNIVVSREGLKSVEEEIEVISARLGLDSEWLARRFEEAKYEPKYLPIVVKEDVSQTDVAWIVAHQFDHPELRIEEAPQRRYVYGAFAAHALGYVGEVSRRELEKGPYSRDNGYRMGDIVGKSGLERAYNEILTGKDGERIVVVDSRGRIHEEVERIEPIAGRDLRTTLDFELQKVVEEQGDLTPTGRGAIAVMDPNNGEILAMVSRPTFDPNLFSRRAKSPDDKKKIHNLYDNENRPLFNRVIQGAYPTGSTWKIFMAVAALNEGIISVEDSKIKDGGLQIGNYWMSSLSNLGYPDIHLAIVKSADGYFYRLGLKMGIERIEKWTDVFRLGQRVGIDLPNERAGIPPSRDWKAKVNPKDPAWRDYDTTAAAIGQGIAITPLQMLRMFAGVAVGGKMATPHLLLEGAMGMDRFGNEQPEIRYADEKKFSVPMSPEIH